MWTVLRCLFFCSVPECWSREWFNAKVAICFNQNHGLYEVSSIHCIVRSCKGKFSELYADFRQTNTCYSGCFGYYSPVKHKSYKKNINKFSCLILTSTELQFDIFTLFCISSFYTPLKILSRYCSTAHMHFVKLLHINTLLSRKHSHTK